MKLYKADCKFVVICRAPTNYWKAKLAIMDKFSLINYILISLTLQISLLTLQQELKNMKVHHQDLEEQQGKVS